MTEQPAAPPSESNISAPPEPTEVRVYAVISTIMIIPESSSVVPLYIIPFMYNCVCGQKTFEF